VQQLVALETDPRLAVGPIDRERWLELLAVVVRCPKPVTQRQRHPNYWLELALLVLRCPKQSVMVYLQAQLELQLALPMLLVLPARSPILMEQRQGFELALKLH